MKEALAYVDPGSGFVFLQNTSFFWGWLIGIVVFLLIPLKFFFKSLKKFFLIFIVLVLILIIAGVIVNTHTVPKKLIVLGIDAMDASITQQLMDDGKLPNFSYLKAHGSFSPLKTTNPSESIVAWSSFITGLNPGGHGVFDFIMRDPQKYLPYLSFDEVSPAQQEPRVQNRRKGKAFWEVLSEHKIPSYIYFCPNTFPPARVFGKMLSGMGVPDILGMVGKFSFYTTKAFTGDDKESRGRIVQVFPLTLPSPSKGEGKGEGGNIIQTELYGPKVNVRGSVAETKVPLKIMTIPGKEEISITFQNNRFILKKNKWSNWQKVSFVMGPFKKAHGIVMFYLKNITPDFELYCSPINFSPQKPPFPISYPSNYSKKLSQKVGLFYTQGMPHDTWALSENRIDENAFLEHTDIILREKERILDEELSKFHGGVFFFYFETLDSIQHMFWRYTDPRHPLYESNSNYKNTIFKYYGEMDRVLGNILKKIDQDTTLIVLSDHGFGAFRRAVHLNRWLLENGFLFLKEGRDEGREFFEDVEWLRTKAYALGFGGIYINREGREKYGIVDESEVEIVKRQIQEKLTQWNDSATGESVIKEVYYGSEIFSGPYVNDGPDMFVGFNTGYRASWQTALGGVPKQLIEDNKKKWSGDHLFDPGLVPGVLFVNKKLELKEPSLTDIASIILRIFLLVY